MEIIKFKISEKVELKTVEAALTEALREVMQKGYPEGPYGLIQRVDIKEKETTVFISGNEQTGKIFANTLGVRAPNAKIAISKVHNLDIMRFE